MPPTRSAANSRGATGAGEGWLGSTKQVAQRHTGRPSLPGPRPVGQRQRERGPPTGCPVKPEKDCIRACGRAFVPRCRVVFELEVIPTIELIARWGSLVVRWRCECSNSLRQCLHSRTRVVTSERPTSRQGHDDERWRQGRWFRNRSGGGVRRRLCGNLRVRGSVRSDCEAKM